MTEATSNNYFGDCPHCLKSNGILNVGRNHFGVCDEHKVFWWIGSNVFSGWKDETEEEWQRNEEKLSGFTRVEPVRCFPDVPADDRRSDPLLDRVHSLTLRDIYELTSVWDRTAGGDPDDCISTETFELLKAARQEIQKLILPCINQALEAEVCRASEIDAT
jgi:hypothetical protein